MRYEFFGDRGIPGDSYDVECDGRKIVSSKDPPGQKSVYIRPGDTERETYRLSTFQHYPRESPVDPRYLASSGFFYTGYKDRVKCFSCGQSVDNWLLTDNVTSSRWHNDECDFINERDERNVPIVSFLRHYQSSQRHASSPNRGINNQTAINREPVTLQRNTSTQITEVKTVNNQISIAPPRVNSATNIIPTPILTQIPTMSRTPAHANSIQTNNPVQNVPDPNPSLGTNQSDLMRLFPCFFPLNPHMRSSDVRRQTFIDHSSTWPAHRIRATPTDIADAGMYYLGERDRVKCWYCNGGLQNWERDDSPWEEHAKWFPLCEFVLQQKGPQFVRDIVARHPGLRRPTLYNPSTSSSVGELARTINQSQNRQLTPRDEIQTSHPMVVVDPQDEMRKRRHDVNKIMTSSPLVSEARSLGFSDDVILLVVTRKYEADDKHFTSLHDLIEAILMMADEEEEETSSSHNNIAAPSTSTLQDQMQRLEESKRCRVCREDDACVVLIPCGHLCCCAGCGNKIKKCPICKEVIRERVRTYIS